MYSFFLSYSHKDARPYVESFFDELISEVKYLRSFSDQEKVGFIDREDLKIGAKWEGELGNALKTCNVLVTLLSPNYFTSEFCGKEWKFFSDRIEKRKLEEGVTERHLPLILPIIWNPIKLVDDVPSCVEEIQYDHRSLGESYTESGLFFLYRQKRRYEDEFYSILRKIAERIVNCVESYPLSPWNENIAFENIPNAFVPSFEEYEESSRISEGPDSVKFVYVVGDREQISILRDNVDGYGSKGWHWKPYLPDDDISVGQIAQVISAEEGCEYGTIEIDEYFLDNIEHARNSNELVILIVDLWSIRLDYYHKTMSSYDRGMFHNCMVLIAKNYLDIETEKQTSVLDDTLQLTFRNNFVSRPMSFKNNVDSVIIFRDELRHSLQQLHLNILNTGIVFRKADSLIIKPEINAC